MVDQIKSWIRENQTLLIFLTAQAVALIAAGASMLTYYVKMETRVSIMETRGAEYTVERLNKIDNRITVIETRQQRNEAQIERMVDILTKGRPPP